MAEAVLRAQAAERSRIAKAVHDDTVQVMTAVILLLDRAAHNVRRYEDAEIDELLENIQQTLRQATERTRRLAFELWPTVLHERGLCPAITVIVEQTGREMGAQVSVSAPPARLQWSVEQLVFRTVQEAVANIRKHSDASSIVVNVALVGDVLVGVVHDDGRGFDLSEQPARDSAIPRMGLAAMVEQVEASGGTVGISSSPGKGTVVSFQVPVKPDRRGSPS
jgi:signal transduction histidine kinase